jgi:hypothetical protein
MGNPKAYITPDVVADFATIKLAADGKDRVKVTSVKGYEPTPLYKVSMAYQDGYKVLGTICISGPNARRKSEKFAGIFWDKVGKNFAATETEYFGWNACHRSLGHQEDGNEIILRVGARDHDPSKLRKFSKMVPALILSGPPGVCVLGGAPKPNEVVSYWPALMPKSAVRPRIALYDNGVKDEKIVDADVIGNFEAPSMKTQTANKPSKDVMSAIKDGESHQSVPLSTIVLGRSGDKGDMANIGVLARSPKAFEWLDSWLTAQRVKDLFQEICFGPVIRYKLDNMSGYNFLLDASLGGGGTSTLRTDAQGKTFAQALLRQMAPVPQDVLDDVKKHQGH